MSTPDHRRWEDDLAAWMLGSLDDDEAERFEQHLAGCERCRADLDWLRPAVDAVPASVTQLPSATESAGPPARDRSQRGPRRRGAAAPRRLALVVRDPAPRAGRAGGDGADRRRDRGIRPAR